MSFYENGARQSATPSRLVDLTSAFSKLNELPVEGRMATQVEVWAQSKGFSTDQLREMNCRVTSWGSGPDTVLCFPGYGRIRGRRTVTAIKYRNLSNDKRSAHTGSAFGEPMVIGDRSSTDWFLAEGETDGARLHSLTSGAVAVMILPAGALAIRPSWIGAIPRNASVYLAHDNDEAGDEGAAKAARMVGGQSVRLSPPGPTKDWSDWVGTPQEFIELVRAARSRKHTRVRTFAELLAQYRVERSGERDPIHLGWGSLDRDLRGISDGQVLGVAARTAVGKTWALNSVADFFGGTGMGTLVASLEMPGVEWAERQLAIAEDIAPEEVERWAKDEIEIDLQPFIKRMESVVLCDQSVELYELPLLLDEARARVNAPVRAIIIDYLGLLGVRGRDAYERASTLGKGLKELAKQERVSVVVAMQLSRAGGDGSTEVTLEMLRDSGVLEESLDFLLGCWRPGKSKELEPYERKRLENVMRVAILKNRKGKEGRVVDLQFRQGSQRVYEPIANQAGAV